MDIVLVGRAHGEERRDRGVPIDAGCREGAARPQREPHGRVTERITPVVEHDRSVPAGLAREHADVAGPVAYPKPDGPLLVRGRRRVEEVVVPADGRPEVDARGALERGDERHLAASIVPLTRTSPAASDAIVDVLVSPILVAVW
jgi:hypothetical protein